MAGTKEKVDYWSRFEVSVFILKTETSNRFILADTQTKVWTPRLLFSFVPLG
jgi:hypothetical protein